MSAITKITVEAIDQRISEFRTVLDRTTGNLVELDADVTRQLLESSTSLRGATAASWADASWRHAELWRGQFALDGLLTQIAATRGTKRSLPQAALLRLDELLRTGCVELPRPPDTGRPTLTEGPAPTVSLTIEEALQHMSEDYEVVARVVAAVADVWGEPTERLHRIAGEVEELELRLGAHGLRRPNELQAIVLAVAETEALAHDDPLSLKPKTVAELEAGVARLRSSLEETLRGREARLADLAAVEQSIAAGRATLQGCRLELDRGAQKILVPEATWADLTRLTEELDRVASEAGLARAPGRDQLLRCARSQGGGPHGGGHPPGRDGQLRARDPRRAARHAHRVPGQGAGSRPGGGRRAGGALRRRPDGALRGAV